MKWKILKPSAELITCIPVSTFLTSETPIGEFEATCLRGTATKVENYVVFVFVKTGLVQLNWTRKYVNP